ncbi:NAD(P)H-hydrate dehydratase [Desulfomonile tiedjei]|uniref:Putative sugar kinase n=1 Tax=Desulfomonile tiedjei (strain ATCC 49306 / DSM 6799 / DCB-1) TaxID=706587 RepID=I4CBB9_DESTA|nr:NAD(P)H-hydrate dehydratase [Desulfomonile tiedjei]AFM26860.1 putative sugar kinase [Desulfomonile tiedjei DSM 6799]
MSWLIVGTVPYEGFPLLDTTCEIDRGQLRLGAESISIARGTPCLIATAYLCAKTLGIDPPRTILAGDIGRGDGSRAVYERLFQTGAEREESIIVFHYLQPEVDWHNRILYRLQERDSKQTLIADAGYMYVAKMSGFSADYDLFTPDAGELAFLADESAPHPFYTRGFLLQEDGRIPGLIARACEHENAARFLLVKGKCDYVASAEGIIGTVCEPRVEALEPIGGTGDSLTGIVSSLIAAGHPIPDSALSAAKINRFLGLLGNPNPATPVADLLEFLPEAMELESKQ